MNTITVNFIECDPPPEGGYNLQWRVAGTADPYTDEGIFTESPIVFTDNINPEGTCYEGFLQSICQESGESGESGQTLGAEIPWSTPCAGETDYTIRLASPCFGISSSYFIENGVAGDVIKVRATFIGIIQNIGAPFRQFTRADLTISSPNGTSDNASSACYAYPDVASHPFSITAESTITIPAGGESIVNLLATTHNSDSGTSSVNVQIVEVNGVPLSGPSVAGCKGNASTGGLC